MKPGLGGSTPLAPLQLSPGDAPLPTRGGLTASPSRQPAASSPGTAPVAGSYDGLGPWALWPLCQPPPDRRPGADPLRRMDPLLPWDQPVPQAPVVTPSGAGQRAPRWVSAAGTAPGCPGPAPLAPSASFEEEDPQAGLLGPHPHPRGSVRTSFPVACHVVSTSCAFPRLVRPVDAQAQRLLGSQSRGRGGAVPPRELSLTRADRAPPPGSPQPAVHVRGSREGGPPPGKPSWAGAWKSSLTSYSAGAPCPLGAGFRRRRDHRRVKAMAAGHLGGQARSRSLSSPWSHLRLGGTPSRGRASLARTPPLPSLHIFLCSLPLRSCPARSGKRDFPRLPWGGARPWQRLRRPRGMAAAAGRSRLTWCTLHSPGGLRA